MSGAKQFLDELNTLAGARSCYPDDEAHDQALERLADRWLRGAEQRGVERERETLLELARKKNYGPTLRTFAKWIARGYHEDGTV